MEEDATSQGTASVRIFGALRTYRAEAGLPFALDVPLPAEGMSARSLACELGLPCEEIEGVFVNHTVYDIDHGVSPGDEIAFVPYGTPGPHRVYLGLYKAGKHPRD